MKKSGNAIPIPTTTFYITIAILVALSSFFRQHDCDQCRNFAFSVDMESCRYLYSYCNFGDFHGYNHAKDFG